MVSELRFLAGVAGVIVAGGMAWVLWDMVGPFTPRQGRAQEWYHETIRLCTEALEVLSRFESGAVEHDDLRDGMGEMVKLLSRHAGEAVETDVDEEVVTALREASLACQELSEAQIKIGDSADWDRALERTVRSLEHAREQADARLTDR